MRVALDGLLLGGLHSGVERSIEALVCALPQVAPQHSYLLVCQHQYVADHQSLLPTLRAPFWVTNRATRIVYEQTLLTQALRRRCDLLHGPGYILPKSWRGPSVLTVYDLVALDLPEYCKPSNVWHYGQLLPASIKQATRIVVPSQAVAGQMALRFPGAAGKMRVIPLGIPAHYAPVDEARVTALRVRLRLPERCLLYVGNLEPKKNLPGLIAAFDQIADEVPHHLILAGRRAWGYQSIEHAAAQARHADRIRFLGYVEEVDLPALYTAAEVLVQWSYYEGMGLPPLEAMACGTPVVVSEAGALRETAGAAALVVPLGPPADLAKALHELLHDPVRQAMMSLAGLRHAARFSWPEHARQVAALYEEAASAHI